MTQVAELAGVSSQTVSRVVNGRTNVDPATRDRVVTAMEDLGYRPNRAARALKSGRFRSLGLMVLDLESYGNTRTANAITLEAARVGYLVTLRPLGVPTIEAVSQAFESLIEGTDGVVLLVEASTLDRARIEFPPGLPAILVDTDQESSYTVVDNDQRLGARLAVEHLLDLGHETVWHLAGAQDSHPADARENQWRETLSRHGRTIPPVIRGDWSAQSGYEAARRIAAEPGVTAVFAANDQMALGLLRGLDEAGRRVPNDISVVGYDDMPESANFIPPLTTVHQSFDRVGVACVTSLVREIEQGVRTERTIIPVELVVRSSTAPPPGFTAATPDQGPPRG